MLRLKKIAITGGVASGKTSVCRYFQELGAFTVNADAIVHQLLTHDVHLAQKITEKFGSQVIQNGKMDRAFLAKKVFAHPEQLDWLEKQLNPMVLQEVEELYSSACKSDSYSSFVVEVPLLFEAGWEPIFDVTIAVITDEKTCQERWEKAGMSPSSYNLRMQRQLPQSQKASRSHFTIQNNGSLEELYKQVELIHRKII